MEDINGHPGPGRKALADPDFSAPAWGKWFDGAVGGVSPAMETLFGIGLGARAALEFRTGQVTILLEYAPFTWGSGRDIKRALCMLSSFVPLEPERAAAMSYTLYFPGGPELPRRVHVLAASGNFAMVGTWVMQDGIPVGGWAPHDSPMMKRFMEWLEEGCWALELQRLGLNPGAGL